MLTIGLVGLPVLLFGMGTFNLRLCLAGAIVSGSAAVLYALLAAWND